MDMVGVLTRPPDPDGWERCSWLLHLKRSLWLRISPGATWCPVSQSKLFKKTCHFNTSVHLLFVTFSQYTLLSKHSKWSHYRQTFSHYCLQSLNAPDSEGTSPAAGTWRQPAESNMRPCMGLIRSIMQHSNHSIQRIWMEIQKNI